MFLQYPIYRSPNPLNPICLLKLQLLYLMFNLCDILFHQEGDWVYVCGSTSGTYAEYALCNAHSVHPLPGNISFSQGAAIHVPYYTAYRALFQRYASDGWGIGSGDNYDACNDFGISVVSVVNLVPVFYLFLYVYF